MHGLTDPGRIAEWMTAWGYYGIFVFVFVGNLGIPVPEETVMLAAGFLAGRDLLDIRYVYAVVFVSAVIGDCTGFMIGRTGGQAVMERLANRFHFLRERYERLQVFFQVHGSKAVFMARFIAGVRFMAGPMAGACKMPFLQFLGWNVLGAMVWCSVIVTVGYLLGDELYALVARTHQATRWIALVAAVLLVFVLLAWWRERQAVTRPEA
jgi:membrane protein DedA with SNARE-associated domain